MPFVRLVCWKEDLAQGHARILGDAGIRVDATPLSPSGFIHHFREHPPRAIVIDLDRLPSHGRELAVALRNSKATRHVPIVFAGGAAEKVQRIRQELPDAFFTSWNRAARAVKHAVKHAPATPVRPVAHMQRYAGTSLLKKLGFTPGIKVAMLGAPEGFDETLGELPEGVTTQTDITRQTKLILWFVRSRAELAAEMEFIAAQLREGASGWIIHPKQASRYKVDFNQNDVRAAGLASGLVDYKVCSVDSDWSGLKFARKKSLRGKDSSNR